MTDRLEPTWKRTLRAELDRIGLILALSAGGLAVASCFDLGNRLRPPTFAREVEIGRAGQLDLAAFGLAVLGLMAARLSRSSRQPWPQRGAVWVAWGAIVFGTMHGLLICREEPRFAARRSQCVNNLKQIGLALHNYRSAHGTFPPTVTRDAAGRPLLSWRVLILPFLEQPTLYSQFHLDEPWDSLANRPLADQVPYFYLCPSQTFESELGTFYQAWDTAGTVGDTGPGANPAATIAVVEADAPAPWTSPNDRPRRPDRPRVAWAGLHRGGVNALNSDGSVEFLKTDELAAKLRAAPKPGDRPSSIHP